MLTARRLAERQQPASCLFARFIRADDCCARGSVAPLPWRDECFCPHSPVRGDQVVARKRSQPIALAARNEDAAVDRARELFPIYQVPVCVDTEVEVRLGCE